ncbi:hypothetical protein BDQ12DRAFT_681098 [Crucibulum laeve]|uniref:RanBD1 domain-containing protein n=1 Tax=Crucibulum laeve TaxID=68775 RepID=A0A5C3M392_9AGAR|nr:hypothetical protein BDQ12DRAFT_681098 [Crucibulum laeve]
MSDSHPTADQGDRDHMRLNGPPGSPPSPDSADAETKLSRKREREVSLEPVTTPKTSDTTDPLLRETRTPAKKNRRHLASTKEEEDGTTRSRSNSNSPPLCVSPPQEMKIKVRQISQGVEDLSWRNFKAPSPDRDMEDGTTEALVGTEPIIDREISAASGDDSTKIKADEDQSSPKSISDDTQFSESIADVPTTAATMSADDLSAPSRVRSESENGDKGLKRKYLERGTSQGPQENGEDATQPSEPLKRPRDDSEHDDNPRETKKPSPPPESKSPRRPSPPSPKVPKLGGFMAYASTSSPFASVKGQNIFASAKPSPLPSPPPSVPSSSSGQSLGSAFGIKLGESSTSPPTAAKRSGFEAFSSSSSPFTSVARSKSPVLGGPTSKLNRNKSPPRRANASTTINPFASYAGGLQSFAVPMSKRARAGSPDSSSRSSLERNLTVGNALDTSSAADSGEDDTDDRPTTFGERLRAGRDEEEDTKSDDDHLKVVLTEQEVVTGEEEEETLTQVRGKLFTLANNQWKERGTGLLKLNVKRDDGSGARLVMRKEAVYTLLLNVTLFPGMRCVLAQDPRYLRFSVIEGGATTHYNLRVSNAKIAQELLEEINANIPA